MPYLVLLDEILLAADEALLALEVLLALVCAILAAFGASVALLVVVDVVVEALRRRTQTAILGGKPAGGGCLGQQDRANSTPAGLRHNRGVTT